MSEEESNETTTTTTNVEETSSLSALDANIKEKGSNAYYFAHSLKINGPKWDGRPEPRLLHVSEINNTDDNSNNNSDDKRKKQQFYQVFDSYAWVDNGKNVKIYIDHENAHQVASDLIEVQHETHAFTFLVHPPSAATSESNNGKGFRLWLNDLNDEIAGVTFKLQPTRFILTLKKKDEDNAWLKLRKEK